VVAPAPEDDVDDAKAPPNDEGALEERLDLLGRGCEFLSSYHLH